MNNSKTQGKEESGYLTKGLTLLLAITCGISVANLYYNQPLLADIANTFQITSRAAGLLSTFTQLGYALGVFLFVPLGDIKEKRKLILTLNVLVMIALLGVASAQNITWLYICCFIVGLTTCIPQIILPLAAQLAEPKERGKVVGTIVSGALIGILLARTISGYIGYLAGWRFMFILAAALMLVLAIILYFKLPVAKSYSNLAYKELIKSVIRIVGKYKTLRTATLTGGMIFAVFSLFWTTITFLLQGAPYNMNSNQIGLFGLFGVVGALGARIIGKLNDKIESRMIVRTCIIICLISYLILGFSSVYILGLAIGAIVLDFGAQGTQVSNQTRIYNLSDEERSRINTVYIVSNFVWGAIGSSLGSLVWNLYNWNGVCILGVIIITIALIVNLFDRK